MKPLPFSFSANAAARRALLIAVLTAGLGGLHGAEQPAPGGLGAPLAPAAAPYFEEMSKAPGLSSEQPDAAIARLRQALTEYRAGDYEKAIVSAQASMGRLGSDANAHVIVGSSLVRLGQFERGMEALQAASRLEPRNLSVLIALANAHLTHGDLADARNYFATIAEGWPGHSEASQGLGLVCEREGRLDEAAAHFEAAVAKLPPDVAGVRLNLARVYNRQRHFGKTIALLGTFAARKPVNESAVEMLALAYLGAGRTSEAIEAYGTAFAASPSAPLAMGLGLSYRQANRLSESRKYLQEAVKMRANWGAAWLQLAETNIALRDFPAALANLTRARSLDTEALTVDLRIADVHLLANAPEKAIEVLRNLTSSTPGNVLAWDRLGAAYQAKGDVAAAQRTFADAAKRFPKSALPPYRLAMLHEREGRLAEARAQLEAAAALEPDNATVQRALAMSLMKSGQPAPAIAAAKRGAERQPSDIDAKLFLAALYGQAGDSARAADVYRAILETTPDHPIALNNLAMIHARAGEFDEALRHSRRAVSLLPESGQLLDTLGWISYLKGDVADAADTLKRAVQHAPRDPSIHFHLGMALVKRNQTSEALQCFLRAVGLSKDFAEYKQAAEMIDALRS